eukprot:5863792-Prymnesium_polylepis.1
MARLCACSVGAAAAIRLQSDQDGPQGGRQGQEAGAEDAVCRGEPQARHRGAPRDHPRLWAGRGDRR